MSKLNITESNEIIKRLGEMIQEQDAREFNVRAIGLKLRTFLQTFTISVCFMKCITLEGLALKCQQLQQGLSFTKQALFKRLKQGKEESKKLLESAVQLTMGQTVCSPKVAPVLEQFTSVLITDATTLSLPDKLEVFHKGLGGTNAKSAMKIQATYDVKNKSFYKISQKDSARENDAAYMSELINEIKSGQLIINDLGYYGVAHFLKISGIDAYFISKIKSNTNLYTEDNEPIDLYRKLRGKDFIDEAAVIKGEAGKQSMKVRLCGIRLPSNIYSKRLREANKKAKASGKELTKEERERLKWILLITNTTSEMLSCEAICEVYRIRWQIEIIFKSWKSHFSIDVMNNVGKDYWDCLLYGRLTIITMLTSMYSQLYHLVYHTTGRMVSFFRFMKNMRENLDIISDYWNCYISGEQVVLLLNSVVYASLIDVRKRKTTEQAIGDFHLNCDVIDCVDDLVAC